MSRTHILISFGLLVTASVSGCSSGGLKNLFSRDDTAGYKPLEQIEAEEAKLAEQRAEETDEESGPRFASWIPFVGDKQTNEEVLADAELPAEDSEYSADKSERSWLKNPLRRDDDAGLNPFLAEDDSSDSASATPALAKDAKRPAERKVANASHEESDDSSGNKSSGDVDFALAEKESGIEGYKPGRGLTPQLKGSAADEFERQFRESTMQSADDSEAAEQLIIAGDKSATKPGTGRAAKTLAVSDKLQELERLLADKKAAAAARAKAVPELATDSAANAAADFAAFVAEGPSREGDAVSDASSELAATTKRGLGAAARAGNSFDRFLGAAVTGDDDAGPIITAGNAKSALRKTSQELANVAMEDAESLFGDAVRGVAEKAGEPLTKAAQTIASADSTASGVRNAGLEWVNSHLDSAEVAVAARAADQIATTADQFESLFAAKRRRGANGALSNAELANAAGDPNDLNVRAASMENSMAANSGAAVQTVSAARNAGSNSAAGSQPADGLEADPFFASAGSTVATADVQTPAAAATGSANFMLSGRNWLLLVGGIIVVALLFAPDRRKTAVSAGSSSRG